MDTAAENFTEYQSTSYSYRQLKVTERYIKVFFASIFKKNKVTRLKIPLSFSIHIASEIEVTLLLRVNSGEFYSEISSTHALTFTYTLIIKIKYLFTMMIVLLVFLLKIIKIYI